MKLSLPHSKYARAAIRFAISALPLLLVMWTILLCVPDVEYASEWAASIVFAVVPVFCGGTGIAGCAAGYFAAQLIGGYTLELSIFFVLAKLPIALAAFASRKYARSFCRIRQIASYAAFCMFACFISFILQCYYSQLRMNLPDTDIYSTLNLLTSNICCVVVYGMPLCALIMRILYGRDPSVSRNEIAQVNTILCFMPLFTTLFLFFFSKCQPTFAVSEEYWCKGFLYASASEIQMVGVGYLLTKWKRQTLIGIAVYSAVVIVMGILGQDPPIAIVIMAALLVYVLIRTIFFKRIEAALDAGRPVRRAIIGCNMGFLAICILSMALRTAILVLPPAEENEAYTIVLGAPVVDGEPSDVLRERIVTAMRYARSNSDSLFFVSGGVKAASKGISEADVIGTALNASGVPDEQIIYEREALTTVGNFQNIARIFDAEGYDKDAHIVMITSEFHTPRAILYAKKAGFHNLVCARTERNYFSELLWSIREAIVFLPSLF